MDAERRAAISRALVDIEGASEAERAELRVYADELLAAGNSRGELVQMSLEHVEAPQLRRALQREQQQELIRHWRASESAGWWTMMPGWRDAHILALTLYDPLDTAEDLRPFLCAPMFGLLRMMQVELTPGLRDPWLDALEALRPPITRLELRHTGLGSPDAPFFDAEACARLWTALPQLRELAWFEPSTFARLEHPNIRTLELAGGMSLPSSLGLPGLEEIYLYLERDHLASPQAREAAGTRARMLLASRRGLRGRVEVRWHAPLWGSNHVGLLQRFRARLAKRKSELGPGRARGQVMVEPPAPLRILAWPHEVEGRHAVWLRYGPLVEIISEAPLEPSSKRAALELLACFHDASETELESASLHELFAALAEHDQAFARHLACFELHRDCCAKLKVVE